MRKHSWTLVFALSLLLAAAPGAEAQFQIGGQGLYNTEGDGAYGVGARVGVGLPVAGLQVRADGNYFFPDCTTGFDCSVWELVGSATYSLLPASPASPYVGAGLAYQNSSVSGVVGGIDVDDSLSDGGFNLLGGVELGGLMAVNLFAEMGYRLMGDNANQFMISTGVLF